MTGNIIDIDLRLVKSARNEIDPPVLQWRKKVVRFDLESRPSYEKQVWTEWEDVRMEVVECKE